MTVGGNMVACERDNHVASCLGRVCRRVFALITMGGEVDIDTEWTSIIVLRIRNTTLQPEQRSGH